MKLSSILNLSMQLYSQGSPQHRNTCVLLGLLAEKLSGPSSIAILTETTLNYLIKNLVSAKAFHQNFPLTLIGIKYL